MLGPEDWLRDQKCLLCSPDDLSLISGTHIKQPKSLWIHSIPIVRLGEGDKMNESKTHGPSLLECFT